MSLWLVLIWMKRIRFFENALFSDFKIMMSRCGMFFYIHTNKYIIQWLYKMMKPQGGYVLIHVNIYIYMYTMILWWLIVMRTRWWLRSTTGPYRRLVIEVAYGEMILSLHRGCVGDDSSGRVVGVSTWCITHVWHTRVNTNVGSVYTIFFGFSWYKNIYICILFSKSICSIKEH